MNGVKECTGLKEQGMVELTQQWAISTPVSEEQRETIITRTQRGSVAGYRNSPKRNCGLQYRDTATASWCPARREMEIFSDLSYWCLPLIKPNQQPEGKGADCYDPYTESRWRMVMSGSEGSNGAHRLMVVNSCCSWLPNICSPFPWQQHSDFALGNDPFPDAGSCVLGEIDFVLRPQRGHVL